MYVIITYLERKKKNTKPLLSLRDNVEKSFPKAVSIIIYQQTRNGPSILKNLLIIYIFLPHIGEMLLGLNKFLYKHTYIYIYNIDHLINLCFDDLCITFKFYIIIFLLLTFTLWPVKCTDEQWSRVRLTRVAWCRPVLFGRLYFSTLM